MQRKLEGKSANELGEGSEIDLFEAAAQCLRGRPHPARSQGRQRRRRDPRGGAQRQACAARSSTMPRTATAWQNGYCHQAEGRQAGQAADHAILSSNKFPKDKSQLHNQDGVIVANPARVLAMAEILRDQIVQHARAAHQQGGARGEDGSALRLHHLGAFQAAGRAGGGAGRQDAGDRYSQGAGGAPPHLGPARQAHPSVQEGRRATSSSRSTASSAPPATGRRRGGVAVSSGAYLSSRPERVSAESRDPGAKVRRPGSRIFRFAKFRDDDVSRSSPPPGSPRCSRRTCRP